MAIIYLGVGSNLGERQANISLAIEMLEQSNVKIIKQSKIIETDPVGGPPQGLFLNGVLKAETMLTPRELLKCIKFIEKEMGRVKTIQDGPRPIDIDILLYDNIAVNEDDLIIPHPRMWERDFVTIPLLDIAPELKRENL